MESLKKEYSINESIKMLKKRSTSLDEFRERLYHLDDGFNILCEEVYDIYNRANLLYRDGKHEEVGNYIKGCAESLKIRMGKEGILVDSIEHMVDGKPISMIRTPLLKSPITYSGCPNIPFHSVSLNSTKDEESTIDTLKNIKKFFETK